MRQTLSLSIVFISAILILPSELFCSSGKEAVISEKDADYLINAVDKEKGKFSPGPPQNEAQIIMSNYMKELNQLNIDTNDAISKIMPIEFSSFTELKDRKKVLFFKNNLKKYAVIKKRHFNLMDQLLKKYRNQLGYGKEQAERLEVTAVQLLEKPEEEYVADLNNFYDFILHHHRKLKFTDDQIYLEDEKLVNDLNKLWSKAVQSASEVTNAQGMVTRIMSQALEEYKKARSLNSTK